MLNTVAYIGFGFVGKACHCAFKHNTEEIIIDPKYSETKISDLEILKPKLTFVSINAPTLDDRTVDASVIYDIFEQLAYIKYNGLVVLKSTLPPDITQDLCVKFPTLHYIYSPEFLREAHWEEDALSPSHIIMAGNARDCHQLELYYRNHSHIKCFNFHYCDYKEAALVKYAINAYLATKLTFMNQMYNLLVDTYGPMQPESWKAFVDMLTSDSRIGLSHMKVPGPDHKFGYGGTCFPKDVKALIGFDKNERLSILREVELANTKIRLTGNNKP